MRPRLPLLLLGLALLAGPPALAQNAAGGTTARTACQGDVQRLCPGGEPGQARACLQRNRDALSPACRDALAAARSRPGGAPAGASAMQARCEADVRTLCPGVAPGGGRIAACLRDRRESVSPGCREAIEAARAAR